MLSAAQPDSTLMLPVVVSKLYKLIRFLACSAVHPFPAAYPNTPCEWKGANTNLTFQYQHHKDENHIQKMVKIYETSQSDNSKESIHDFFGFTLKHMIKVVKWSNKAQSLAYIPVVHHEFLYGKQSLVANTGVRVGEVLHHPLLPSQLLQHSATQTYIIWGTLKRKVEFTTKR